MGEGLFLDDPHTLFVSPGGKNEQVCCNEFAPFFWAPAKEVADLNRDGAISWQERYAYAEAHITLSEPQIIPTADYVDLGKPSFSPHVVSVDTKQDLEQAFKRIKPGQHGVILFGMVPCGLCRDFMPKFSKWAAENSGRTLWVKTNNTDLAAEYGITQFPTVMLVDSKGHRLIVGYYENALAELQMFESSTEIKLKKIDEKIVDVLRIYDPYGSNNGKVYALQKIINSLPDLNLGDKTLLAFEKLIAAARKFEGPYTQSWALFEIAKVMAQLGLRDRAAEVFEESIRVAAKMENNADRNESRTGRFAEIAKALAKNNFTKRAVEVFEKSIADHEQEYEESKSWSGNFSRILYPLKGSGLQEEGVLLFRKLESVARKMSDEELRFSTLCTLAQTGAPLIGLRDDDGVWTHSDNEAIKKEAFDLYEQLIDEARLKKDAHALATISWYMARCRVAAEIQPVFQRLFAAVSTFEDQNVRRATFAAIAQHVKEEKLEGIIVPQN